MLKVKRFAVVTLFVLVVYPLISFGASSVVKCVEWYPLPNATVVMIFSDGSAELHGVRRIVEQPKDEVNLDDTLIAYRAGAYVYYIFKDSLMVRKNGEWFSTIKKTYKGGD